MNKILINLFILFFFITNQSIAEENIMILKLKDGDVKIELFEDVAPNHVKRIKTSLVEPSQTSVVFFIFVTNKLELHYTRRPNGDLEDGVKALGTITLPLYGLYQQGEHRDIYLTFGFFSHTEIQVHVYDATTNIECTAVMIDRKEN